jgi:hemerythrin
MALITWRVVLAVNIKEVDDQHKQLIEILNTLHDSMRQEKGKKVLDSVLKRLADYTVYHFGTEERLFQEYGYPEAEEHKREHDAFTKQVLDFQKAFEEGRARITVELLYFLTDWLKNHIIRVDRKFGEYVTRRRRRSTRGSARGSSRQTAGLKDATAFASLSRGSGI